uniref:Uncharacterized protein n=1 Tax=viral metagenome TaxID=1070528 RepID=A0A6M3KBB7_9ZZZZ
MTRAAGHNKQTYAYGNGCRYCSNCFECPFPDCKAGVDKFIWNETGPIKCPETGLEWATGGLEWQR